MSGFEPLELKWSGRTHLIRPHRMMGALQIYERSVTPPDFQLLAGEGMGAAPSVCASAYGRLLRYAGATVSDEDVYLACREEMWVGEKSLLVIDTLLALQWLRFPPEERARLQARMDQGLVDDPDAEQKPAAEGGGANPTPAPGAPAGETSQAS